VGEKREKKETEYKKKKDIQDEFIKTTGPLRAKMMQHLKDGGGVLNHTTKVVLLNPSADLANRPWWDNLPQAMDPLMAERFAHRLDKKNPPPFLVMTNRGPMSFADFIRIKLRESSGKAALHAEARKKIQKDI
jgi:hypothetical protein